MQKPARAGGFQTIELDFEDALMLKARMTIDEEQQIGGNSIYMGSAPDHGKFCLIIPALGNSALIKPREDHSK